MAPLSRWLLVLATALLVAWCVPRVKPVLWFGGLFGVLTGAIAVGLERWFGQPAGRSATALVATCAIVGSAAVFGFSIQAAERLARNPKDAVAEALLRSMEQRDGMPSNESSPKSSRPDWSAAIERYVTVRYRNLAGPSWMWLAAEIASAGLIAGLLHRLMNYRRRPATEAAP